MSVLASRLSHPGAQHVLGVLTGAGHAAYFVGGTVRNALIGAPVTDFDIATAALPQQVQTLAEDAGIKVVATGIDHGTLTLVLDKTPFEVTTFRRDVATDGRRATVAFAKDVAEDARRRDFTMNALYATAAGEVIDPLGGLPDLEARKVRFIDDPEARIREDYLRILRFFRFTAWYGDPAKGIDAEGLTACAALADGLQTLSTERVTAELLKLLAAPDPAPAVASMGQSGILSRVLPGAADTALAPLVHLEPTLDLAPDGLRRLAALGGDAGGLRLSKVQARHLATLRSESGGNDTALHLGQRLGPETAAEVLALRAASLGQPIPPNARSDIARGAAATFPVRAADLPADLEGPAIGAALGILEAAWRASDFRLDREALLARL
ncbi:CCA tRNA nucleotidyltransferase [Dinoroseobacter sp. PD6]|uniref:CCA tRNA nucleotidyltransferase n=1 Tax=Dinoroseobacter sp. PD6 TaxID=3028384 RepID=UPI00237A1952|nr:CCA tRNA nucleotidyltransferase [Dinoroseobacter sp. PD6]MDD9718059.1 CCA tRNA nucleotidyltransferase [Dinoroseobacter sp. PD6]